jgi:uncharacterized protein
MRFSYDQSILSHATNPRATREGWPVQGRLRRRPCVGLAALACLAAALASAQPAATMSSPSAGTIESKVLGETRPFWVSLPDEYEASGEPYAVLYLLDGEHNFTSGVVGGLRYAASLGEIPELIVVAIKNTDRSKDIFPEVVTYQDGSQDGGRANQFLDFIAYELVPYVDAHYRTQPYRVLYGTSNTGFTAVYAHFTKPGLASATVAASPTLSIKSFIEKRDELIKGLGGEKRRLVMVMGENDFPTVLTGSSALKERIDILAPAGLECRLGVIARGGHVPPSSLVTGMRALFEGWPADMELNADTYQEVFSRADRRLSAFGVAGNPRESDLKALHEKLLGEAKNAESKSVAQFWARTHPRSAAALVAAGDSLARLGETGAARESYRQALRLDPANAVAASRLQGLGK